MRKKKMKQLSSLLMKQDTTSAQKELIGSIIQDNSLRELHNSCHTLPLRRFMHCLCYNDIKSIIIKGMFTVEEVQQAWINIYSEFIDLSDSADKRTMFNLTRNITMLKARLLRVQLMVKYLAVEWNEEYVNDLRALNFRYKFDPQDKVKYSADLEMILTRIIGWEIDLAIMENEYQSYEDKNKGDKPSMVYFNNSLVRLGKWVGGGVINPDVISTALYCETKNQYHEYIEQQKIKYGKH